MIHYVLTFRSESLYLGLRPHVRRPRRPQESSAGTPSAALLQSSVHSSKFRMPQLLCFHTLRKTAGVCLSLPKSELATNAFVLPFAASLFSITSNNQIL